MQSKLLETINGTGEMARSLKARLTNKKYNKPEEKTKNLTGIKS